MTSNTATLFKSRYFIDWGPTVLTPGNFNIDGGLYWGPKTKYTTETYTEEFVFQPNDLVVVITDLTPSAKLLGSPAFIPNSRTVLHNQRIGRIFVKSEQTTPEFLYWVFLTHRFKNYMAQTATGSTVRHTSPCRIKDYIFALPPKNEQRRIVKGLPACDRKTYVEDAQLKSLDALFQTLLHHLMTGRLRVNCS